MIKSEEDKAVLGTLEKASTRLLKASVPPAVEGMVAYVDAGARPNPGFAGVGMHGFVYNTALLLKGVGLNSLVTSTHGYVNKEDTKSLWGKTLTEDQIAQHLNSGTKYQVMPERYFDYYATVEGIASNNLAEMLAVTHAIELAVEEGVRHLQIFSDSELTCKGVSGRWHQWAEAQWLRPDGTPRPNAEGWQELKRIYDWALTVGMTIKVNWVRSHNGDVGNELADLLATMAVFQAQQQKDVKRLVWSPREGYWKPMLERHPFLASPKLYFNTLKGLAQPGVYYLGHHGKDDDLIGTRNSETHLSMVKLKEPIKVIETIRELQASYNNAEDRIYQLYMERIFNPNHYKFLNVYGGTSLEPPAGYRQDLVFVNGPALTREFKPALLAGRIVDGVSDLEHVLELYEKNDVSLKVISLTELLYDITAKPEKKGSVVSESLVYSLKKDIGVGSTTLDVILPHPFDSEQNYMLKLTLGLDLLERNALKRLESLCPRVDLILWQQSELVFRFATIIKAGEDTGIWAAPFSNLRVIVPPRTQEHITAAQVKKKVKKKEVVLEIA